MSEIITNVPEILTRRSLLTKGFKAAAAFGLGAMALNLKGDLNPFVANAMNNLSSGDLNFVGGDFAVPGDYDGDGKTDVAVYRRGAAVTDNLAWYILKSSGGGFIATSFGVTEYDAAVQNDYDGDGKTDIAVWRETEGNYYYLSSLSSTITGGSWGLISDLPIASYDTH